jgi:hypothetical protein
VPEPLGHEWDREIADRLSIELRPYSTNLHSALGLVEFLRRKEVRTVISCRAFGWLVEFQRAEGQSWDSWPIGAKGRTLPDAIVRAVVKLMAAIDAARVPSTAASETLVSGGPSTKGS